MPTMPTMIAVVLAFNLTQAGKPARVVHVGRDTASVVMEGRPGCYAEAANKNPSNPVIFCKTLKKP